MISSLRNASTGLTANQMAIDTIANNIANVNTAGYKKQRANFEEAVDGVRAAEGDPGQTFDRNRGAVVRDIQRIDMVGPFLTSSNPLDVAVNGSGYFPVTLADGTTAYSRDGSFHVDGDRQIVNSSGQRLSPPIAVPAGVTDVAIGSAGRVTAAVNGATQQIGQLSLAVFPNAGGLAGLGNGAFRPTDASGAATVVTPGQGGSGELVSGALEGSNVDIAEEMTNMLLARRAYGLSAKAVQTIDEMLQGANALGN